MRTFKTLGALQLATLVLGTATAGCISADSDSSKTPTSRDAAVAEGAEDADEAAPRTGEETKPVEHSPEPHPAPIEAEREEEPADEAVAAAPSAPKTKAKRSRARGGALAMPSGGRMMPPAQTGNTEAYDHIAENDFIAVADDPRSTFSIDVDTASYSNVRRFIEDGSLPPADAVRIEEMINYFSYDYDAPTGDDPFSLTSEVSSAPWNEDNLLVHVGLQGETIDQSEVPPRNLVFLFDVSGSMNSPDKLPLVKQAMSLLVPNLRPEDRVSIVVYAGASGMVLEPTSGSDKGEILAALDRLEAGGSTNGGAGIQLAYRLAEKTFVKGGINRVILATDGDFNVGTTSEGELVRLIEQKRKSGVFLSVFGFGTGNLQDSTMEKLADKGNGNYAYIDSIGEARKVLVEEAGATLVTIAKDVKIQVEFNPREVEAYRLIGYENRKLAHSDFNDDTKDAGEIGAGHSVTALYEIVPAGSGRKNGSVDGLKYQKDKAPTAAAESGELLTLKIRYKQPNGDKSKLLTFPITGDDRGLDSTSKDYRFAAAVAELGMLLRDSKHKGDASYAQVLKMAEGALGRDAHGHRREFLELVRKAERLASGRGALVRAK